MATYKMQTFDDFQLAEKNALTAHNEAKAELLNALNASNEWFKQNAQYFIVNIDNQHVSKTALAQFFREISEDLEKDDFKSLAEHQKDFEKIVESINDHQQMLVVTNQEDQKLSKIAKKLENASAALKLVITSHDKQWDARENTVSFLLQNATADKMKARSEKAKEGLEKRYGNLFSAAPSQDAKNAMLIARLEKLNEAMSPLIQLFEHQQLIKEESILRFLHNNGRRIQTNIDKIINLYEKYAPQIKQPLLEADKIKFNLLKTNIDKLKILSSNINVLFKDHNLDRQYFDRVAADMSSKGEYSTRIGGGDGKYHRNR